MSSLDSIFSLSWGASDDDDVGSISNNSYVSPVTRNDGRSPNTVLPTGFMLTPRYHNSAVDRAFNTKNNALNNDDDLSCGLTETAFLNPYSFDTSMQLFQNQTATFQSQSILLDPNIP